MKRTLPSLGATVLSLLAGLASGCGSQDLAAAQQQGLSVDGGEPLTPATRFVANFGENFLSEDDWSRRENGCSALRNACVDDGSDLVQTRGDGKLTLHSTAAFPAGPRGPRIPARYPSLDLAAEGAAITAGKCMEFTVHLPTVTQSYGGVVLAPADDAMFNGQIYVVSATENRVRMGLACAGSGGTITFSRPVSAAFLQAPHTVRFCADSARASWHLDGDLWAEVVAEELSADCGEWPFGDAPSPLLPHFVVSPTVDHTGTSPAAQMSLERLDIGPAKASASR